ncbi:hypothetical protein [Levilinea saccharolytica]|uniref:Glycoside hydrolase family 42 N-terminal domain-containing protein n=1 Tax=Levilinea saccharolytica TaxID=229921 RepID=A0A0N8GTD2_9CHLR|nr:hypothetical protein [Levilinea saccharolytica]KPL91770.1 hypothetical protein ADN01_00335 [Levilinea saccharolytica]GAP17577.1 hypothetical protein LSAC_01450 [Levilinea saccharolytica]
MRFHWKILVLFCLAVAALTGLTLRASAEGEQKGGRLGGFAHLNSSDLEAAAWVAGDLGLDWVAVELDWAAFMPAANEPPDWAALDRAANAARQGHFYLLLSLTNAPDWARTDKGPDAQAVRSLVEALVQRYPEEIRAYEIFPAANTAAGWGAAPNPQAYVELLAVLKPVLQSLDPAPMLVAGGLVPVAASDQNQNLSDLTFLSAMYDTGLGRQFPVISLRYPHLQGRPDDIPQDEEPFQLRHYEDVRRIMIQYEHKNGRLWITRISPPSGRIESSEGAGEGQSAQAAWLKEAIVLAHAQVYMDVIIFHSLTADPNAPQDLALLSSAHEYHPFYQDLRSWVALNAPEAAAARHGRIKKGVIEKQPRDP